MNYSKLNSKLPDAKERPFFKPVSNSLAVVSEILAI